MDGKNQINGSVGIDIGGTKITAGVVVGNKLIKKHTLPTPSAGKKEEIIEIVAKVCREMAEGQEVSGVGIGVPGLVDVKKGVVHDVANIPSFKNVPLKELIEKECGKPVFVNNDANCFTLGAKNYDVGRKFNNIVGLTLGTGLGGGVVINGHLYEGLGCGAGEFGYLPYRDGILEHYCSGQFFQRKYDITGKEAYLMAKAGEEEAFRMFDLFGLHVGEAVKLVAHVLAPEAIILGGSLSRSFDYFKESMWVSVRQFPYKNVVDDLVIVPVVNPDVAVIGAASLVFDR